MRSETDNCSTIDPFRQARWLNNQRVKAYAQILLVGSVVSLVLMHLAFWRGGVDFLAFWTAARMVAAGTPEQAFDAQTMHATQQAMGFSNWGPFLNPPPFLAIVAPVGRLTYLPALAVWLGSTATFYVSAARLLPRQAFWPALAYPAAFFNGMLGQNGFLTAALFLPATLLAKERPWIAGACAGALVIKPHLAILIPLAYLASGCRRAFAAAAAAMAAVILCSLTLFGAKAWRAYLASARFSEELLKGAHDTLLEIQSVFAAARQFHGDYALAVGLQGAAILLVGAIAWRVWRRWKDPLGRAAILAAATPLATPYIFEYDLLILVLPLAWLGREGLRRGFRPWERLTLLGLFLAPAFSRPLMMLLGGSVTPLVCATLLAMMLTRGEGRLATPRSSSDSMERHLAPKPQKC